MQNRQLVTNNKWPSNQNLSINEADVMLVSNVTATELQFNQIWNDPTDIELNRYTIIQSNIQLDLTDWIPSIVAIVNRTGHQGSISDSYSINGGCSLQTRERHSGLNGC